MLFRSTDISVIKDTKLKENVALQFRAEFFNLFNHTNWGLPIPGNGTANLYSSFSANPAAAGYGSGTVIPGATVNGNQVKAIPNAVAGKILYTAGAPRLVQFALKLTF